MSEILGYTRVNGNLEVNETEAKIVRFYFDKTIEYSDNPPQELVFAVMEEYECRGEKLSYEDAAVKVSYDRILAYVQKEAIETFKDYFESKRKEQIALPGSGHTPVVGSELWRMMQRDDIASVIAQAPERFSDDPEAVRRVVSILEENGTDVSFTDDETLDEENGEEI